MPYDVPHVVSPGLWALAWKRLRSDRVAMVSLVIVAAFLVQMVLSGTGLIAKDWAKEVGVNYAPPTFEGPESRGGPAAPGAGPSAAAPAQADVMADIRAKGTKAEAAEARASTLPLGGDKWGRDVLKKTIKGSETSIF